MNKKEKAKSLRLKGLSYRKIGDILGVSWQRAWQLDKDYVVPAQKISAEKLKIMTKRKRIFLGLPEKVNYIGGGGRNFTREIVRQRDKQTCQKCKKVWKEGMRKFDVHHLEESMLGKTRDKETLKYDRDNMDKLITFCHKCHYNWHKEMGHTKTWYKGKLDKS